MKYNIAVVSGDGIGPSVTAAATAVMEAAVKKSGHSFSFTEVLAGGKAIDQTGVPLPDSSLELCKKSDAVLLGAVGGPKWDTLPGHLRPERALLGLRKGLGLYANLRPAVLYAPLKNASPLSAETVRDGIDLIIVRELTGGIYYGDRGRAVGEGGEEAYDTERYSRLEIERIGKVGFELAMKRKKKLVSIDKANVLESSRLWREVMHSLAEAYPEVSYSDMLVDNAAMQLVRNPSQFDVAVTSNMFGDILSDEAAALTGSIGLLSSASLGEGTRGLYEPAHGSAPDIAGKNIANPLATILSAAMLLRLSLGLANEADNIERAVSLTLEEGWRTRDIAEAGNTRVLSTTDMTGKVIEKL